MKFRKIEAIKFTFWTIVSVIFMIYFFHLHTSGTLARWYYYKAAKDGYAINVTNFWDATKENPATLKIAKLDKIATPNEIKEGKLPFEAGLVAIPVKKGDSLPEGANGVIEMRYVKEQKRLKVEGDLMTIWEPWKWREAKGVMFKDSFQHKAIEPFFWSAFYFPGFMLLIGVSLGLMADGFTSMMGMKVKKIEHH